MTSNPYSRLERARRQMRSGPQVGGQTITEPGNPDFSPSASSSQQVPAAAAQAAQFENQRTAQRRIDEAIAFGYDTTTPEWEPIVQQAETGFKEQAGNFIGTLVGWIDGSRQAVNLAIQDLVGGEAEDGYRNPNFLDYWDTLWGGMEDSDGFTAATGLDPISGSHTLDMFGWDLAESDDLGGRILRGAADFGLQVATDPLTYVTFGLSGVAKKTALAAARGLSDDAVRKVGQAVAGSIPETALTRYERSLFSRAEDIVSKFDDDLQRIRFENGGTYPQEIEEALINRFGSARVIDMDPAKRMEAAIANAVHDEVIRPLAGRDFANIAEAAFDSLPAYTRGGARISVPFGEGLLSRAIDIPGTRGLGRKLVGDPLRTLSQGLKDLGVPGYEKLADTVLKSARKMDRDSPLIRAMSQPAEQGGVSGWQWHILQSAEENMMNNAAKHTISTNLNSQWNRITEQAVEAGVDINDVGRDILFRMEGQNVDDTLMRQLDELMGQDPENLTGLRDAIYKNPDLDASVQGMVTYMQETMGEYHAALSKLDPSFKEKFIKGYIPHSPTKQGRELVTALAGSKMFLNASTDTAEQMASQLVNAAGRGGVAEAPMGATRYVGRQTGRVQALQLSDDGIVMLDQEALQLMNTQQITDGIIDPVTGAVNTNALETRYIATPQLNAMLAPILEREARKHGVVLPKDWDGKIFNENPVETMVGYIDNMSDAIQAWQTVDAMKQAGLAITHSTEIDMQKVTQNMFNNVVRIAQNSPSVKFGKLKPGQRPEAPTEWLKTIVNADNFDNANTALGGPSAAHMEIILADMGVKGSIDDFVFHGTTTDAAANIERVGLAAGGASASPTRAFEWATNDGQVLVFRRSDLGPSAKRPPELEQLRTLDEERRILDTAGPEGLSEQGSGHVQIPEGVKPVAVVPGSKLNRGPILRSSIEESGVQRPVQVSVWRDGQLEVLDGHHRIAAADQAGINRIPVEFRREGILEPSGNAIRVTEKMRPEWFGTQNAGVYDEILANPDEFVYHGTNRISHDVLNAMDEGAEGFTRGGLTADRTRAENYTADTRPISGSHSEGGLGTGPQVLVFRKSDLPVKAQRQLDKGLDVEELFPSGDFTQFDPIVPVARYNPEDGFDSLAGEGLDDLTRYPAGDVFTMTPWGPAIDSQAKSLLASSKNTIPGVPNKVHTGLKDAGFEIAELGDVEDVRKLAKTVAGGRAVDLMETAPVPRPSMFEGVDIGDMVQPGGGWKQSGMERFFSDGEDVLMAAAIDVDNDLLRINIADGLSVSQTNTARRAAIDLLDREFTEGSLKGMLSDSGLGRLVGTGLDPQTADLTHEFLRRKLGGLPPTVQEFIAKEPAEIFQTRMLWDDFVNKFEEVVGSSVAVRDASGNLIADPKNMKLTADDVTRQQLAGLQKAAEKAGDAGYDAAVNIMRDVVEYTGVRDVPGMVNPGIFKLSGPAIDGLAIQRDLAEWLSLTARNHAMIHTPEGVMAAKLATNQALKWWRAMATLPRPAFHIRNLVGGAWQNMAFGVKSSTMAKVSNNALKYRNGLRNATGINALEQGIKAVDPELQAAFRAAHDHNVLAGFSTTEFSDALTPAAIRQRYDWAKVTDVDDFALTRAGARAMESVEDFLRMSLFVEYFDEAVEGSARHAAELVNTVHFDYSNLTPSETFLKSLIPFFVWTRRNLPLQIRMAAENPRILQRYGAMMRAMNDNLGGQDPNNLHEADHFSAYAAGTNYKVNPESPFWARVMIDPDLPVKDLLDIPNPEPGAIIEFANQLLGPHVSSLVDINAQRDFGDVNAPAPLSGVLQGLAALGLYDTTLDGDVRVPYYLRTLNETIVPFQREIFDPLTGGPTDPNRRSRLGITPEDNPLEAGLKSAAAQLAGGFGIKLSTPADTRAAAYSSDADLDKLIKELRLQGDAPQPQR